MEIKIGDRLIGLSHPTYFIADIAANHDGDLDRARMLIRLAKQAGATLVACGSAANEVAEAPFRLPVPQAPLPVLSPLLSVVPGQLFAAALARAKGLDPDHPAGLSKVTLAQ
jgi:fructoselysine-6-P-deglycase FrlB-like protein